jgi:hypothetical protein
MSLRVAIEGDPAAVELAGLDGAAPAGARLTARLDESGARATTTAGELVWTSGVWPARDELFELPPPAPGGQVLVVAGDGERRASAAARLAERGIPVGDAERLTAAALRDASAVAFLPDEERELPMPPAAAAVLAAGRHLIAPRCSTTFGLLPGTDHLPASTEDDVVQYAHALHRFPDAMRPFTVFGRLSAQAHRASAVYLRLLSGLAE